MMADYSYNQVTPELIEEFKKIVPGKVFTGDEIMQIILTMKCQFTEKELRPY